MLASLSPHFEHSRFNKWHNHRQFNAALRRCCWNNLICTQFTLTMFWLAVYTSWMDCFSVGELSRGSSDDHNSLTLRKKLLSTASLLNYLWSSWETSWQPPPITINVGFILKGLITGPLIRRRKSSEHNDTGTSDKTTTHGTVIRGGVFFSLWKFFY